MVRSVPAGAPLRAFPCGGGPTRSPLSLGRHALVITRMPDRDASLVVRLFSDAARPKVSFSEAGYRFEEARCRVALGKQAMPTVRVACARRRRRPELTGRRRSSPRDRWPRPRRPAGGRPCCSRSSRSTRSRVPAATAQCESSHSSPRRR